MTRPRDFLLMRLRLLLTLSLLLSTSACSAFSGLFAPSVTPAPTATITVTPVPPLTEAALQNAAYTIPGFIGASNVYQLVNGKYNRGTDASAPDFADVRLLDTIAFGDLNDDGVDDAAAFIAANYGGTGVFVTLVAVLNVDGEPRHMASTAIDDRPQINTLKISNGQILLDAVVHNFDDPACCPTFAVRRAYQIIGPSLTLVNAASQTPNGNERAIVIETPLNGMEVSGALVVSGRVTIAPFENNLGFRAYNEHGNELTSGPVPVTAADLGAPGTFAVTLDLAMFPPGRLYVEISDLSAADGSVLALASVMIVVK